MQAVECNLERFDARSILDMPVEVLPSGTLLIDGDDQRAKSICIHEVEQRTLRRVRLLELRENLIVSLSRGQCTAYLSDTI